MGGWGIIASFAVRSHALAHIHHATLLYVLMHLHTYVMLRCCTFSCTCTHTSCYAAVRSHALAHIHHATLLYVLMHLHTYVMLRRCTFSCTCTHTSCQEAAHPSSAASSTAPWLVFGHPGPLSEPLAYKREINNDLPCVRSNASDNESNRMSTKESNPPNYH